MRWIFIVGFLGLASTVQAEIRVVTSLPDYAALVQEVGGEHVQVDTLASSSQDPHFVDAKPSYVLALNRADLVVVNGLELEIGWMPVLLVQARNPKAQPGQVGFLDVGTLVEGILGAPSGHIDRSMGDIHPGGNPHYSYDPVRMLPVVDALTERLSLLEPEHADDFEKNRQKVKQALTALVEEGRTRFAGLSQPCQVVEYHKTLAYLFDTLGIEVFAHIEPKPGVAPSPGHVAKLVSAMRKQRVRVVVHSVYNPAKMSRTVAQLTKAKRVVLSGGPSSKSYVDHVRSNIDALFNACEEVTP